MKSKREEGGSTLLEGSISKGTGGTVQGDQNRQKEQVQKSKPHRAQGCNRRRKKGKKNSRETRKKKTRGKRRGGACCQKKGSKKKVGYIPKAILRGFNEVGCSYIGGLSGGGQRRQSEGKFAVSAENYLKGGLSEKASQLWIQRTSGG